MKTDWNNLFKIRIANPDESFQKHEIVKLLIVMKILNKSKRKEWMRIYTEFQLENGLKADIYYEDVKNKSVIIYEIQKDYSDKWLKEKTEQYKNYEVPSFSVDFIPINLNDCPENISEINIWLNKYIF